MTDPNKTIISGAPGAIDPNRTQMVPGGLGDPNRTQAMTGLDPNRTTALQLGPTLTAELLCSREATMANGPAREQFLLDISAGGSPGLHAGAGARTPLNLCLVIDRSGSMEGAPLEYVKQACSYVVDLLTPNDVLSIVTFEETVDVLMSPQRVTNKQPIKDGIARLEAGNTTNLYDGLALALQQVVQSNESSRATRMVVLSDGDPTVGIKDYSALVQHAANIKAQGVTVTFLGFGPDYNEELLAGMAKKAGGNYYFIPRPELIPEIFRTELEKLMTVVARNLTLHLKTARWVSLRAAPGVASSPGDREFSFPLADLERGATLSQVLDFDFNNHPLGHYRVAEGRLTFEDCLNGRQETIPLDFVVEFTADEARYSVAPNPKVSQAAQLQMASRTVEKTIMGLKTQQITSAMAVAELQKTQALLLQQGRTADAQEVTMALRAIQSGDTGSAEKTLMGTMHHLDQGKH